jgi:hydrogenase large subunit
MTRKVIFPVTRIHEPLKVDVDIEGGRVTNAWVGAWLFRGFETMMAGRDPRDAALFLQRICGICSSAHAVAAVYAQQQAFNVQPTPNGQHLTNLIFAADIIQNHLRHFYTLVFFDYVTGPDIPPWLPRIKGDYRLPKKLNDELFSNSITGLKLSARAHEMMAIFGAKAPHQQTIMITGVTEQVSSDKVLAYSSILREIKDFVEKVMLADVMTIGDYYKDYYNLGVGYGNFLSYGMFPEPITGNRAFAPGVIINRGPVGPIDSAQITEAVKYSWYSDDQESRHPREGKTVPDKKKAEAYTWTKAPRYQGLAIEGGPLARGWINGDYRRGISVMDRLVARARETLKICNLAEGWLGQLVAGGPTLRPFTPPPQGEGEGLTDAMRGPLGHWFSCKAGKIVNYQVVTPTTWNFSPRDSNGVRGLVEEALIGTPVADPDNLIEVGRVVRSFDPCLTCAVHAIKAPNTPQDD